MAITAGQLKLQKAVVNSDAISNGGRMSNTEIVSGTKNALIPDVSQSERTTGIPHRYRKIHCKVANDDDLELINAVIHWKNFTPGLDRLTLFEGTHTDTQNDIVGTERKYGAGALRDSITSGGNSLVVTLEDSSQIIFANTDKIFISDGTGEEYHEDVTISKNLAEVTITLDTGDTFTNSYSNSNTYVASVLTKASIKSSSDAVSVSGSGTLAYDNSGTNTIVVDNIAGVADVFTGTIQADLNTYTMSGEVTGALPNGTLDAVSPYAPPNANQSNKPYFTIITAGWSGTPAESDTFTITTYPAAQGVWVDQVVPALTDSYSGNGAYIRFGGESA